MRAVYYRHNYRINYRDDKSEYMNEDKVVELLMRYEEDIKYLKENSATKSDVRALSTSLDELLRLTKKKDQELTMITHGMRRMSDEIDRVKKKVGIH